MVIALETMTENDIRNKEKNNDPDTFSKNDYDNNIQVE